MIDYENDDEELIQSNPFDEGDPRYDAWNYRHTDFAEPLIKTIIEYGARWDTMQAFKIYIYDLMSDNAFMSNQTSKNRKTLGSILGGDAEQVSYNQRDKTENHLEICREMLLATIDPIDLKKNWVYQVITEIENHTFNWTLTRTTGADREGVQNRIQHSKTTQEIKQWEADEKKEKDIKKSGWL